MKNFLILLAFLPVLLSCNKKVEIQLTPLTSFNVTNAVAGGDTLTVNTSNQIIPGNSAGEFALKAGQSKLDLYNSHDPTHPYFDKTINTADGSYYSLFLGGASPSQVDAVLVQDDFKNYTDSLTGVRFVNMSASSAPVSINAAGSDAGSTVSSLAYKSYTGFQKLRITYNQTLTFEFRDAVSGALITTYTFNPLMFHNTTLVFAAQGGSVPVIIQANNYD